MLTDERGLGIIDFDELVHVGRLRQVNVYIVVPKIIGYPPYVARSLMIAGRYTTS